MGSHFIRLVGGLVFELTCTRTLFDSPLVQATPMLPANWTTPEEERPDLSREREDYWARYNKVADEYDTEMLQQFHVKLDVLLIFVSLRSSPQVTLPHTAARA